MSIARDGYVPTFRIMRNGLRRVRNGHDWIFTRAMNPVWATSMAMSLESDAKEESNQRANPSKKGNKNIQIHQMTSNLLLMHLTQENKSTQQSPMIHDP
jgi:hypothetical protein